MAQPLGILLISPGHERAHYAFMLAAAAAAIGRPVTLFATNEGCRALATDPALIEGWSRDADTMAQGVAGLAELRDAAGALGVTMLACEAGLRMARLAPASLLPAVGVSGIPTFLSAVGAGTLITL